MSISERAGGGDPCPRQPPGAALPALGFVLIAALKRLARLGLLFPAKVLAFDAGLEDQHTKIPSRYSA